MPKHVAIYCRVSSSSQDTRSQQPDLERWAASQGEVAVWYSDSYSGKTMDRPGWKQLEANIAAGKVSTVAVWRLDRLGRTARGLTALFEDLRERKVNLVSLRDGIDLSTTAGRLMANVLASVAQYETEVRAERVRAGQLAAKAKGKRWGGSRAGVRKKVTATMERTIRRMVEDGETIAAVARVVKISRPTVYSVLNA
jgi:DNA invertase Pin-like site-specific DNA recombinase